MSGILTPAEGNVRLRAGEDVRRNAWPDGTFIRMDFTAHTVWRYSVLDGETVKTLYVPSAADAGTSDWGLA